MLRAFFKNKSEGIASAARRMERGDEGAYTGISVTEEQRSQSSCPAARPTEVFLKQALRPKLFATVRRGLLRRGFDHDYTGRVARELEEHWHDLVQEGLRQGLPDAEAEARATLALGPAEPLIVAFSTRLRQGSWIGRYPTLGFGLLALLFTVLWWAIFVGTIGFVTGLIARGEQNQAFRLISPSYLPLGVDWIRWGSYFAVPLFICCLARRFHCGWQAALWGCLVVAVHNSMHAFVATVNGEHGSMSWAYGFNTGRAPDWLPILAPVAVFALDFIWNSRSAFRGSDSRNSGKDVL